MSEPVNILGKIGKYVGEQLKALQNNIDAIDTNNIDGDVAVTGDIDGINLTATGDLIVGGHLECDSLLVKGETKVVNTNKVELSDDILEINFAEDGTAKSDTSGIAVNQGTITEVTETDVFDVIGDTLSDSLTNAVIINQTDGITQNNLPVIDSITFNRTLDASTASVVVSLDEDFASYIKDLNSGNTYGLIYASPDNNFFLKPFFSVDYDSTEF